MNQERLQRAFDAFDAYNSKDPNKETYKGKGHPKELLYAIRMTERLNQYSPAAPEYIQLAARSQHIGRWEMPRKDYAMDRKGYLQWRNQLKFHHARIAEGILLACDYDLHTIETVKFLLLKRELQQNPDTQLLEDVICLVFIEHYLEDFAAQHEHPKVVDIVKKTMKKMTQRAINSVGTLDLSEKVKNVIQAAAE